MSWRPFLVYLKSIFIHTNTGWTYPPLVMSKYVQFFPDTTMASPGKGHIEDQFVIIPNPRGKTKGERDRLPIHRWQSLPTYPLY